MKDRLPLRKEFDSIAKRIESNKQHKDRTAQLEVMQSTIIRGFNHIVQFLDGKVTKTEVINQLKEIKTPDVEKVVQALEKVDKTISGKDIDLKPILEAMKGLRAEIATIEKKTPEFKQRESIKVENLDEISLDTSAVVDAIKALKLKVDAPVINTEKTDLKPLQAIMLDLLKAFSKFKVEPTKEVKVSNLSDIKPTETKEIEKKLDTSNKYLKEISEKRFGGGGGGGESTLAFPLYADIDTTFVTVGAVKTITKTDGTRTKTITIDKTDPNNFTINTVWS